MQDAGDCGYHSQAGRGPLPAPRAGSHALRPAPPPTGRAGSNPGPAPRPARPELGGEGEVGRGAGAESAASKEETDRPARQG